MGRPRCCRAAKNVKFIFVGDGPLRPHLTELIRSKKLEDHVQLLGLRLDVADILHAIDIFCLASHYEGMGRVILEAQAAGKPVVARAVGGINNITQNNKTAILISQDCDLSSGLSKLISDSHLRAQMGREAFQFVDARFTADKMIRDIGKLYESFLKNG